MSTYVLVHGAWHGGWCWHKIKARLEAKGHTVFTPDMPGHGTDPTPIETVTLDSIVAKIAGVIDAAKEPVILVGHSYGGTIITQTGEVRASKIKKLVYLTAFVIPNGALSIDVAQADTENDLGGNVVFAEDGKTIDIKPEVIKPVFYAQCSEDDIALARIMLRTEATAGFQVPVQTSTANWGRLPKIYIECAKDRAISITHQRRMQANGPCDKVFSLDTDHSPFFSTPDELTAILADL